MSLVVKIITSKSLKVMETRVAYRPRTNNSNIVSFRDPTEL
jgi:hypothetical protein